MSSKDNPKPIQPLHLFDALKDHQSDIVSVWMDDLKSNPQYDQASFQERGHLDTHSGVFLKQVISTISSHELPEVSREAFQPVFKLWHEALKTQRQQGLNMKESALLIFSLKSSLRRYFEEHYAGENGLSDVYQDELSRLSQVLDLLGLLTIEIYSAEQDSLISRQQDQISFLQSSNGKFKELVGNSPAMQQLYTAIGLILENDITVLLEGETGTGKDLIASTIHSHSKRQKAPFVALNCGAIPKDLIESELFGHEKGAFTGADERKIGKFELADGGTLFLDEVGELPLDMQVKLLRALQNREIVRIGGNDTVSVDVRIIAATNKRLKEEVDSGSFRSDLYYRLNVFPILVPPLRERDDDIVLLATHFTSHYSSQFDVPSSELTPDAIAYLKAQHWEGNIRELENAIQRAIILAQGRPITSSFFDLNTAMIEPPKLLEATPEPVISDDGSSDSIVPLDDVEKDAILNALELTDWNIYQAAESLGVSRTTLYSKLKKYGISEPDQ